MKNRSISLKAARRLAGQQEWANHFLENGSLHCFSAYRCIQVHERDQDRHVRPSSRWKKDLLWSLERCQYGNLRPFIENPCYLHGGNVEGDASTLDGWGFHIGPIFASGLWDSNTRDALKRSKETECSGNRISISPLELWVQALIAHALGKHLRFLLDASGQYVSCCDNESACIVVDTLRPKSEAMHVALSIKVREETTYKLKGKLQHIPGEKNIISDLLSHNRIHEAVQLLRSKWGDALRLELSPCFISDSLKQLCFAINDSHSR